MSFIMPASNTTPASNTSLGRCVGMHPNYINFSDDEIELTATWLAGFCGGKKLCKKFPCIAMRALDARLLEYIREVNATKVTQKYTQEEHDESESYFKKQDQADEEAIADAMADDSTVDNLANPPKMLAGSAVTGGPSHSAAAPLGYDADNGTTDQPSATSSETTAAPDSDMPDMSTATII